MKIAVIGGGKLGTSVTKALVGGGNEITVIDTDESVISRIQNTFDVMTLEKDARNSKVLADINIKDYDGIICCMDDDEKNIFVASLAKKLGCKYTIARVRGPEHVEQMDLIKSNFGIDYVTNSDLACATEMYKFFTEKHGFSGKKFSIGAAEVLELSISQVPDMMGKMLKDAAKELGGLLLTAISRNGKIIIPNGNTELLEGDHLYVAGTSGKVKSFRKQLKFAGREDRLKRVMIGGGGKTGFFLAQMLEEAGVSVKIIETDKARCEYLSESLEKALVLKGNASDMELLAEENIDEMDGFVAATNSDETNILLALMAQKRNVKNVIAKVSSTYYNSITEDFDETMTINPVDMCTSNILRKFAQGSSITFTKMVQGQAEFVEVLAEEGMPLTASTLLNVDIPEGVLVATVTRGNEVIIPTGNTKIEAGDKVVILALLTKVGDLEALLKKQ